MQAVETEGLADFPLVLVLHVEPRQKFTVALHRHGFQQLLYGGQRLFSCYLFELPRVPIRDLRDCVDFHAVRLALPPAPRIEGDTNRDAPQIACEAFRIIQFGFP